MLNKIFTQLVHTTHKLLKYRKIPKFSDAKNFSVIHLEFN